MADKEIINQARQKAEDMYRSGRFLCSEAVFLAANEFLERPVPDEMVRLASGFPVGMGLAGCVCGALSGGVMALGIKFGRTCAGEKTPGMFETAKELHDRFIARRHCACCHNWKHLEDLVRAWGREYGSLWIVVGPVLKDSLPTIGANRVAVPEAYFKVIADLDKNEEKMIAFLIPNQASKEPLEYFAVSVDSVEHLTGIDFFPELPDSLENMLENTANVKSWDFSKIPARHHRVSKIHSPQ